MQNENSKENTVKDSVLVESESFSQAIASRDEIIAKKNETIKILQSKLGEREEVISNYINEVDKEKSLRIEAENKVAVEKKLDKNAYNKPKSREEQFAEFYKAATEKFRSK